MADPIKCIIAINNVKTSVQGNDPRGWMKACAKQTLLNGKQAKYFENPKGYADELYNEIKSSCS